MVLNWGQFCFLLWLSWKRICLQCRRPRFDPWVGKIPRRRERLPTPVFWPGEFRGQFTGSQRVRHGWATFTHLFPEGAFGNVWRHFWFSQLRRILPSKLLPDILQWAHRIMPATNNYLVQNVDGAEVKKPWWNTVILSLPSFLFFLLGFPRWC